MPGEVAFHHTPASSRPALWLAEAAAAAWRRHLVENKRNWSRWYEPHTALIEAEPVIETLLIAEVEPTRRAPDPRGWDGTTNPAITSQFLTLWNGPS